MERRGERGRLHEQNSVDQEALDLSIAEERQALGRQAGLLWRPERRLSGGLRGDRRSTPHAQPARDEIKAPPGWSRHDQMFLGRRAAREPTVASHEP